MTDTHVKIVLAFFPGTFLTTSSILLKYEKITFVLFKKSISFTAKDVKLNNAFVFLGLIAGL